MHLPPPANVRPRRRRRLFLLAALSLVSLLSFGILEVGVRLLAPQPASWLAIYQRHPRLPFFSLQPNQHALVDTGETHWEVWTDADGCRRGREPANDGKQAVLWSGDSFTFGNGVDFEQSWIGLLASGKSAGHRHKNLGVGGHGPQQYLAILEDTLRQSGPVSLVVVTTFVGNDFHDTIWSKDAPVRNGLPGDDGGLRAWAKRNLHAYRLASRVVHRLAGSWAREEEAIVDLRMPERWRVPPLSEAIPRYREAFEGIARLCADRSIPLVVVVMPTVGMVRSTRELGVADSDESRDERGVLHRALGILHGLGLRVVDATPALAEHDPDAVYFQHDQHLTPLGHSVVADLLLRSVPELGT